MNQEQIWTIKRVAADLIKAIDPDDGSMDKNAPLGVFYMKAFEVWKNESIFLPQKLLEDGGVMTGARTAIYNIPTVPKTEDYDPNDWNWAKIPAFISKEIKLDIDTAFKIQRRQKWSDLQALHNHYKQGNYETVVAWFSSLVKNIQLSAAIKRNTLITQELYDQVRVNGIVEVNHQFKVKPDTAFETRRVLLTPIADKLAKFRKFISYAQGIIGTAKNDWALLVSHAFNYELVKAHSIQGSDKSYDLTIRGELERTLGVPIVEALYLDNKFSVSEEVLLEEDKWVRKPIDVDTTGVDAILFHKNVFAYKFASPIFLTQMITATDQTVFTHIEYYSKKRMGILPMMCVGFKFNLEYDVKDTEEEQKVE